MATIQGIYLAFFGRPADPLGLAYWEERTNNGADLSVMLNALSGTREYQDRFVGMSDAEVIQSIYQALFGRNAEPDGVAFFIEALGNGTQTLGSIAVNILDGAQGTDKQIIENRIAAADRFTALLDTPEEIAAYSGNEAARFGRQFLSDVTEDPATVPGAKAVQERIDAGMPNYDPGSTGGSGMGGGNGPDDGLPPAVTDYRITVSASSTLEGAGETITFTVSRSGPLNAATIDVALTGTATSPDDYVSSLIGTALQFVAGETTKSFTVTVTDDEVVETSETITATLSNASDGGRVSVPAATTTIVDDDGPAPSGAVYSIMAEEPVRVLEGGDLVFTVTRSGDLSSTATVTYSFSGEATPVDDYEIADSLVVTFQPGQTSAEIVLSTVVDEETEVEESVIITLGSASDGLIADIGNKATGYIRDGGVGCVGPDGERIFINFDDLSPGDGTKLQDGYHGFYWREWWARDNVLRSQNDPHSGWYEGIKSAPNAIYPSFGAQFPDGNTFGYVSTIAREAPFVLESFYLSSNQASSVNVKLTYHSYGVEVGAQTFTVATGAAVQIIPDLELMYANCITSITWTQNKAGASFVVDDMTFIV